jgi:DNA-binding MarR family transcriptional regulator
MTLDYFWLLAPVSAGFGALVTSVVLRRFDISRMSYRDARQMLSAMVGSLSTRIEQNEALTKELSEQLQILSANQTRFRSEGENGDKERLLGFMQDWMGTVKRVIERVDGLQKNLKSTEQEVQEMRAQVNQLGLVVRKTASVPDTRVGVVTEDTLAKLTPTERGVLELLADGGKAAPEIGRLVAKSREHTARLMKSLFEQGFVEREANRQPYEYRLNDKVREVLARVAVQEATPAGH